MKKNLMLFLLLALLLPATTKAHDFYVNGIYYNIKGNEAIVTYRGSSYSSFSNEYNGDVTIPSQVIHDNVVYTVTTIDSHAFYECKSLTSINLPNTITCIGTSAFEGCSSLTNIEIPNSVTSLGSSPFYGTAWYNNQPNGLVYIGKFVHDYKGDMPNGTNIVLKDNTIGIAAGAFFGLTGLKSIVIGDSVKIIGAYAFYRCGNLSSVTIGKSVTNIDNDAFHGCYNLESIIIPYSVTTIGDGAFSYCYLLNEVKIPITVTHIGSNVFQESNTINSVQIYGEGEWKGGSINCSTRLLYIDSRITSLKGLLIKPSIIYCYAKNPPTCDENTYTDYSGILHVPATSLAAYFTSSIWSNFYDITGDAVEPIITLNKDNIELQKGNQFNLIANFTQANAYPNTITWESTDSTIASVDNGIVTALNIGECDIIAKSLFREAVCHVTVEDALIVITLNQSEAHVLPNHIISLIPSSSADILPELSVSSSAPSVAAARIVNDKVQIVGIKEGMTIITVESEDNTARPATCLVTVYTELGDVNCDGFVNIADVTMMIDYLLGNEVSPFKRANADINNDSNINIMDVTDLIDQMLSSED